MIADGTDQNPGVKQRIVGRTEGVGKNPAVSLQIDLIGPVVLGGQQVGLGVIQQRPRPVGIAGGQAPGISLGNPARIGVVVIGAGDEIAGVGRIPEGLADLAPHGDGTAVFAGHTEHLGAAAVKSRQNVR